MAEAMGYSSFTINQNAQINTVFTTKQKLAT
jgi:hypothetical protein